MSGERTAMDPSTTLATNGSTTLAEAFQPALIDNLYYAQGAAVASASIYDYYMTLSETVRRRLLERWRATTEAHYAANPKFVY